MSSTLFQRLKTNFLTLLKGKKRDEKNRKVGEYSVIKEKALIPIDKMTAAPLHTDLGLFSQLIKSVFRNDKIKSKYQSKMDEDFEENDEESLDASDDSVRYWLAEEESFVNKLIKFIKTIFPRKSIGKIEAGSFDGSQIKKLINNRIEFEKIMEPKFKDAWLSYLNLKVNFFGNYRSKDYKSLAKDLIHKFEKQGCLMSVKLHYLNAHLDKFPENNGHQGEQQGERGHQDLKEFERRYTILILKSDRFLKKN